MKYKIGDKWQTKAGVPVWIIGLFPDGSQHPYNMLVGIRVGQGNFGSGLNQADLGQMPKSEREKLGIDRGWFLCEGGIDKDGLGLTLTHEIKYKIKW